ncbi:TlpA family protein disulfide reductase [Mucilaginibacter lappiensis]|uniref:TlpA family protein disulfide reductase n=1 Tax=Mucilaginibacter lappiensis TaxID=354630 RepID=UPI003D199167
MKYFFTALIIFLGINNAKAFNTIEKLKRTKTRETIIRIFYPNTTNEDTLVIYQSALGGILVDIQHLELMKSVKSGRDKRGWFNFKITPLKSDVSPYFYVCISQLPRRKIELQSKNTNFGYEMIPFFLLKNGDNIVIQVTPKAVLDLGRGYRHNFSYRISGKGALMQRLRISLDSIQYHSSPDVLVDSNLIYNKQNYANKIIDNSLSYLKKYQHELTVADYAQLKAYCVFSNKSQETLLLRHLYKKDFAKATDKQKKTFLNSYDSTYDALKGQIAPKTYFRSKDFIESEFEKVIFHSKVMNGDHYLDSLFKLIKKENSGEIRDRLYVEYLSSIYGTDIRPEQLEEAIITASNPICKKYFMQRAKRIPGNSAYNFNLQDSKGNMVKLSDFKGKVILIDFWYTGCSSCINFYQNVLSKVEAKFESDTNVVFITVSIDKVREVWEKTLIKGQYTSSKVINLYTNGQGVANDVIKYYGIHSFPQPILIGKDQRLKVFDSTLRVEENIMSAIGKAKME